MYENDIEDIKERLAVLEQSSQSRIRFFLQYLMAPILVVLLGSSMGIIFNYKLEERKTRIQEIELTRQMLPDLFSDDEHIGPATQEIIERVLEDQQLKEAIITLAKTYAVKKIKDSIDAGDTDKAQKHFEAWYDSAKSSGGDAASGVIEQVEEDKATEEELTKFQKALRKEREGFKFLIDGKYDKAIAAFEDANKIYNGFHQVFEIANELKGRKADLNDTKKRKQVFRKIVEDLSWKAPKDLIEELRELSQ